MAYDTSVGYKILKSRTQVFENFENDKQLDKINAGKSLRVSFYEFLEGFVGDEGEFDEFCNKGFIRGNKLKGDEYPNAIKGSILGHCQTKKKFTEALAAGNPSFLGSDLQIIFDIIASSPDPIEKKQMLDNQKLIYDRVYFGRYMSWSYVGNNYTSAFFENTDFKKLPYILGLPEVTADRYIVSHVYPVVKDLFQPTAFDAGTDNTLWRPGGKTLSLAPYTGEPGKDEVVHKPNTFGAIIDFEHNK